MKELKDTNINTLEIEIKAKDFVVGIGSLLFIGSIISIVFGAGQFFSHTQSISKGIDEINGSSNAAAFGISGPTGGGGSCSKNNYCGGLCFSQAVLANPLYSYKDCCVMLYLSFSVSQEVKTYTSPYGQKFTTVYSQQESNNIGVNPNVFLFSKPYSKGNVHCYPGIVHNPTSLNCNGVEYEWDPSFSIPLGFFGTPKLVYDFQLTLIIQNNGKEVKIFAYSFVDGQVTINYAEIIMGLISIPTD